MFNTINFILMSFQLVDVNRYSMHFSNSMKKCKKCQAKFHTSEGLNMHFKNSH